MPDWHDLKDGWVKQPLRQYVSTEEILIAVSRQLRHYDLEIEFKSFEDGEAFRVIRKEI